MGWFAQKTQSSVSVLAEGRLRFFFFLIFLKNVTYDLFDLDKIRKTAVDYEKQDFHPESVLYERLAKMSLCL